MREQEIQFAIEDARYEKKEKRTKKLNCLKVELINLGMLIDKLERKLLYENNSE